MLAPDKPDTPRETSSVSRDDSDQTMDVYSGVRWSAVAKYSTQFVEVGCSIVVARIVAPEAYGLLGMAVVITGFLVTFQSLGFGSALIQRKQISESLVSSLFYVNMAVAISMTALLICGAPLFSRIYSDPRVGPIIAVLSVTLLISAPGLIPSALLTRQLAFQRMAWVDISVSLVRGTSVIAMALAGLGVWALVWSSIAGATASSLLLYVMCSWRPRWLFCWGEVRSVLGFGANLTGFSIFNYFARNADNFIIGAFLGATPLGYYSLAYRILLFPRNAITGVLMRVLFPAFSRMQDDDARFKAAYLRACGAIAFLTFPMMMGMLVVARPFVEVILGEKWLPAVPLIAVLAPLGALQTLWSTVGQIFIVKGRADWYFRWGVVGGVIFIISFISGLPWGVLGVAVAYTIACVPWSIFSFWLAFRLVHGLTLPDLARSVSPYFWMSASMGIMVALLRRVLESWLVSCGGVLSVCIGAGILTYTLMTLVSRPPAFSDFVRLLPSRNSLRPASSR